MTPEQIVEQVERARTRGEAARKIGGVDVSEAFFQRVASLAGQDPTACIRLARRTDWIVGGSPKFLLRARAVGARAAGRWQSAADYFFEAGRHCRGVDRWIFSLGAIDSLARAGKPGEAVVYGRRAIRGLKSQPLAAARARLNVANALVWQDRNREALSEYRRAAADLPEDATQERAIANLGRSTASLFSGNPDEGAEAAEVADKLFRQLGMDYHADLARLNLAHAELLRGRPDDAVRNLLELQPAMDASPPDAVRVQEFLADCYLQLNLPSEAEHAYRSALALPAIEEMPLNLANCRCGLARLLDRSDSRESQRLYRLSARGYGSVGNRPWQLAASGRSDAGSPERCIAELKKLGALYLSEDLAIWAAEKGHTPIPSAPRSPLLQWRHALLLARRAPTLARYAKVFDLIERDRLAIRTPSAALRFYDDRGAAVNEYLELLIRANRISEAISVISRARSTALLDEILASEGKSLPEEAIRQLESIRAELAQEQAPGTRLRHEGHAVTPRRWTEATWLFDKARTAAVPTLSDHDAAEEGDVWLDTGSRIYRLSSERAVLIDTSTEKLSRALDWLEFFLFEPMVDPDASWNCPTDALHELRNQLGTPAATVCPDGVLWRAPWPLLTDQEVTLRLNPARQSASRALPEKPRIAIWAAYAKDLPSIDEEIESLLVAFPEAELLTSRTAIRSSYRRRYDVVHVAGHARINPGSPALSYIEFGDGPLYAAEIARSGLRTDLAIVAACRSGLAQSHQKFEPEGIARAFLACGAHSAVGSLWPLDDRFTAHFMRTLYSELAYGKTLAEAMGLARQRGRVNFPHPYYWGALATFGGYR